ncbi:hypothetical protein GCM10018793_44430 [Streptomyces sulfonofaciens]|uniref:Mycothiol-dependent maleylpyruvate isomerase metal-binding domain-containing protein n=1 Tax=Streptomyces sulfonofaciens TaxID=68272 RepID=A0A919GDZ3_9ACTN|nr:maleylpyruvate isomerase N-terminal domain-containing protein [Streptomyces sulfonofaciens]GHH83122.1 hypothetical protein GCM10018793_44430 [Streptomyces sulfonofaciens]
MSVVDGYLAAAEHAVALLGRPEVAEAWREPGALAGMSVGALAGHLAHQILSVDPALDAPPSPEPPITLLEHFARAEWVGAPLDGEVSTGIRAWAESVAAGGPSALHGSVGAALAAQRGRLAGRAGGDAFLMPQTGWALTFEDFLATRLLELAVHSDDLAVSVGLRAPELPAEAFDPVLVLLARLAARRHGQTALLRALTRAERAPAAVNAI